MCAGKGIIHAEMPVHTDGAPDPRGLQLWVDLPKEVRILVFATAHGSQSPLQFKMVVRNSIASCVICSNGIVMFRILRTKSWDPTSEWSSACSAFIPTIIMI